MEGKETVDRPDLDVLVETVKRIPLFEALSAEPLDLRELDARLVASRSTIHRTAQRFVQWGLLEKSAETYELTGLGRLVAAELSTIQERANALERLAPFVNTIDPIAVDLPVEAFADATVASPSPGQPHVGVKRITEGIRASSSLRMFSSVISPIYVDVASREMHEGTEITVVFDAEIIELVATEYYEEAVEALRTGNFDVYVHDDVPFELFLFEDSMGMAAHDENGIPRAFVETDAPGAMEWAEELYRDYERAADKVALFAE